MTSVYILPVFTFLSLASKSKWPIISIWALIARPTVPTEELPFGYTIQNIITCVYVEMCCVIMNECSNYSAEVPHFNVERELKTGASCCKWRVVNVPVSRDSPEPSGDLHSNLPL